MNNNISNELLLAYLRKYLIILVICIVGTGYWMHSSVNTLQSSVDAMRDQVHAMHRMAAND